jgi:hypothetical protein
VFIADFCNPIDPQWYKSPVPHFTQHQSTSNAIFMTTWMSRTLTLTHFAPFARIEALVFSLAGLGWIVSNVAGFAGIFRRNYLRSPDARMNRRGQSAV